MITAERRPSEVTERPRPRSEFERVLRPADEPVTVLDEPATAMHKTLEAPLVAAVDLEHTGDETGLLLAFVVTTLVMVFGVIALAVLQFWWLLVPVVLVHWIATYVILARINGLLSQ